MKIKTVTSFVHLVLGSFDANCEYDVEKEFGKELVKTGLATEVIEEKPKTKSKKVEKEKE